MVERCCFCIGLRTGTIIIAILLGILSTVGAFAYFAAPGGFPYLSRPLCIALGVGCVIRALAGYVGVIGAIVKSHRIARVFSLLVSFVAFLGLAMAIVNLVEMFKNQGTLQSLCIEKLKDQRSAGKNLDPSQAFTQILKRQSPDNSSSDDSSKSDTDIGDSCSKFVQFYLAVITTVEIIMILLTFYFASVVSRFAHRLKIESAHRKLKSDLAESTRAVGISGVSNQSHSSGESDDDDDGLKDEKKLPRGIHTDV